MTPRVISYYTPDYAEHAVGLEASLDEHAPELERDIVAMDEQMPGGPAAARWQANSLRKAHFCLEQLAHNPRRGVLWLDADARLRQRPALVTSGDFGDPRHGGVHMAAHWREGHELLSGTLYLAGTRGLELAKRWVQAAEKMPSTWDQRLLGMVLHQVEGLRIEVLPAAYTWIEAFMCEQCPRDQVVVEHLQESRRARQGA